MQPGRQARYLRQMLLVLAFFTTGCGSSIDRAVEQTIEQTHQIEPTGTFSIRNAVDPIAAASSNLFLGEISFVETFSLYLS
jgi:hypothetical protein